MMVGNYSYPTYRLGTLLKDVRTLHEKFGKKSITSEHIAQVLGHKLKSGGFNQKLADLKSYGLLDGSRGSYTVSDIGIKATFGTKEEMEEALDKAVRRIDLWRLIYDKCGKSPEENTFWIDLADITGIPRPDSQTKAVQVRKAYIEDAKYILTVKAPMSKPESKEEESGGESKEARDRRPEVDTAQLPSDTPYIGFPEYIKTPIVIKDELSFKAAEVFWKAIEAKFAPKQKPREGEKEGEEQENKQ